jgi:hypothetical protein
VNSDWRYKLLSLEATDEDSPAAEKCPLLRNHKSCHIYPVEEYYE